MAEIQDNFSIIGRDFDVRKMRRFLSHQTSELLSSNR
jgi:hypothetical protein